MFVVSANYRDRQSEYKWLVRRADQEPAAAVPCKAVQMRNVQFRQSSKFEEGFGCKLVAYCETVRLIEPENTNHDLPTDPLPGISVSENARGVDIVFNGSEMCKLVPIKSAETVEAWGGPFPFAYTTE